MNSVESLTNSVVPEALGALSFDEDGFLLDPEQWSEETARLIADIDGLPELGPGHLQVIHYVRERFLRLGALSSVRQICRSSDMSKDEVQALFGSCLQMWRVAGLSNPGEEAKSYMS